VLRSTTRGGSSVVGPEACGYNFLAVFKKNNIKLGTKLNIYFKLERTLQQIANLKRLKNTTNITKSSKNIISH